MVLAVGANLFDEVFYNDYNDGLPLPEGCALIQVDTSSWEIAKNIPATIGLQADPKLALQELAEELVPRLTDGLQQRAAQRRARLAAQKQHEHARQAQRARDRWDSTPIASPRLMAALRDSLPDNVVVYNEAITATADLMRTLSLARPGSLFGNHGGGIGQGLPGALSCGARTFLCGEESPQRLPGRLARAAYHPRSDFRDSA